MVAEGADILDIGGESTRPGFEPVAVEEELRRIVPVIRAVREALPHIPLSIDTYKAETARQALEAGAHIINDIWGLKGDPNMAAVAAEYGCPVIINHNRHARDYNDLVPDVLADLQGSVSIAQCSRHRRGSDLAGSRHRLRQNLRGQPRAARPSIRADRARLSGAARHLAQAVHQADAESAGRRAC